MNPRSPFALVFACGLFAGCSVLSPKPDLSQSYLLTGLTAKVAPSPAPDLALSLAVNSPEVPDYLDRPQMFIRLPGGQVSIDEFHRWTESMGPGFARVLAQDVTLFSDSAHVAAFPVPPGFGQEFELSVQILQFDGAPGGDVTLLAQWRISGPGGKPNYYVPAHPSTFTRHADSGADPFVGYVNTLSLLIGDLAREVVKSLPEARAAKAALR